MDIIPAGQSVPSETQISTPEDKTEKNKLIQVFEEHGITDDYLVSYLKHIIEDAEIVTPKGEHYEDCNTKLQAIKEILKIKRNTPDFQINIQQIFWGWNL